MLKPSELLELSAIGLLILAVPYLLGGTYGLQIGLLIVSYSCAAIGTSMILGPCREVSLGHGAFFGIGAYCYALMESSSAYGHWVGLLLGIMVCAITGLAIGWCIGRLTGPRFALATIAVAVCFEQFLIEAKRLTGGFGGIGPLHGIAGQTNERLVFLTLLILLIGLVWLVRNFYHSPIGRLLFATGDDPVALASVGISRRSVITYAVTLAAVLCSIGGWIYAGAFRFVSPDSFSPNLSVMLLTISMLGGAKNYWGPLLGSFIILLLPELLSDYPESRLLIFGVALMLIVYWGPEGLGGFLSSPEPRRYTARTATDNSDSGSIPNISESLPEFAFGNVHIKITDLRVAFDGIIALDSIECEFPAGQVTCIVGANGAGKTTLLNALSGLTTVDQGSIWINEKPIAISSPMKAARTGIARTFQVPRVFSSLNVIENVLIGFRAYRKLLPGRSLKNCSETAAQLLRLLGFKDDINASVDGLSINGKRIIEIARCLATRPSALLLDEPSAGCDADELKQLLSTIHVVKSMKLTILIVTHDLRLIENVADQLIVLDSGRILYAGKPAQEQLEKYMTNELQLQR